MINPRHFGPLISRLRSISFSQYGEDVLLSALVPGSSGFYVDVGAFHPWKESNTFKLYLKGWRGLTIEPNPDSAAIFRKVRPRDTHIVAGIAGARSTLEYFRFADGKLNTFSKELKDRSKDRYQSTLVECRPLTDVLDQYCPDAKIDFLSIDCEGHDLEVLDSVDFTKYRPVCVCVEDIELYRSSKQNSFESEISRRLRSQNYVPFSQALFSFMYVDRGFLDRSRACSTFDLSRSQAGA